MKLNEIKKALYKENSVAELLGITKNGSDYRTTLANGSDVFFFVPHADIGNSTFYPYMKTKHLIRYITTIEIKTITP